MKTAVFAICLSALALVFVAGCNDRQIYQVDPALEQAAREQGFYNVEAREVDLVEKLAADRASYFADIEMLKDYYNKVGNQQKYYWASKEAEALGKAPKYKYLMAAEAAGTRLKALESIPAADKLFANGMEFYRQAVIIPLIPDKSKMRKAISNFNRIIEDYPTSDKIDDAAYRAGELYEKFSDYAMAANYYQKAYLWNDMTPYPARYKAAKVLDSKLKYRKRALALYRLSVEREARYSYYKAAAQKRILELTVPEKGKVNMKKSSAKPAEKTVKK